MKKHVVVQQETLAAIPGANTQQALIGTIGFDPAEVVGEELAGGGRNGNSEIFPDQFGNLISQQARCCRIDAQQGAIQRVRAHQPSALVEKCAIRRRNVDEIRRWTVYNGVFPFQHEFSETMMACSAEHKMSSRGLVSLRR